MGSNAPIDVGKRLVNWRIFFPNSENDEFVIAFSACVSGTTELPNIYNIFSDQKDDWYQITKNRRTKTEDS